MSNITPEDGKGSHQAKYIPQKNHSITVSPLKERKKSSNRKKKHRNHKNKSTEDEDDDFTSSSGKHKKSYLRNCIKKRLNNNYEKQINCRQDENVVFTDNKIYISLASRNSSLTSSSNNHLKKNRRIIYPTSSGYKVNGFLRDYDFNYESPSKKTGVFVVETEEKLKFNIMNEACLIPSSCSLHTVVFEKVKVPSIKNTPSNDFPSLCENVTNYENNSYINSYLEDTDDDEDDAQWRVFVEIRKHGKSIDSELCQKMSLSDSGFGSQLLPSCTVDNKQQKLSETLVDEEAFDNSFNEELEQRASIMVPDLVKTVSPATFYNHVSNTNQDLEKQSFRKVSSSDKFNKF